ncbi:YbaY family lipoprotein [Bradyrhizobium sp.]|uniref:YbaY family lipoprotein n=1 Tax=Bradyrhizobium sp. TaxID=376 RepID=UPI0025C33992|nr:YbaY family lipoprotein [Bradyrhizobium sp.]
MATFTITGWIRLPSSQWLDGATAIVGLDDVSTIDAPSVRIAETVIAPVSGTLDRIPFSLAVPKRLPTSASYTLSAEIRRSGPGALRRGDFLSTTAIPWTEGDVDGNIIDVRQI